MDWNWVPMFPRLPGWLQACWVAWAVAGIVLFVSSLNVMGRKPPGGKIEEPQQGQVVAPTFQVHGSINDLPQGHSLWLAMRVGDRLWPKEPKISPTAGKWFTTVSEGGSPPERRFSIVLLATNQSATTELERWFKRGDFSGIRRNEVPGITELDEVPLKLQ